MTIEAIGWMIGFYIVTRMVSFLTRQGAIEESYIVKILAKVTILVTVVLMFYLLITGMQKG